MTAPRMFALVKFCREESHADQFIKGLLYMNRLRYFQQLEASEKRDGRSYAREAIVSWHQPDRTELILTFPGVEPIKLDKKDLAAPVAVT
jgi:hypothetical protein